MSDIQQYDAVIIGSGPVGSSFARTLADEGRNLKILVLEAGPQITSPVGRHVKTLAAPPAVGPLNRAVDEAPRNGPEAKRVIARPGTELVGDGLIRQDELGMPAAAMSTGVGGMGIHWTCACPIPGEGERIPFIAREEFESVFNEAWRLLNVTQSAFLDAPLGAEVRAVLSRELDDRLPEGRKVQPMPLGIQVDEKGNRFWTGTEGILGSALDSGAVELRVNAPVTRIVMRDSDAVGVIVREEGEDRFIGARVVYVAADSFRTPRLLHVSGVRPRALGHYLNDHPQVFALARLDDALIPEDARTRHESGFVDPLSGVSWIPYDRDSFPFHGQIMQLDASPVPVSPQDEPWPGSIVAVGLFGCKDIRFEDSVEFDYSDVDALGLPSMRINYKLTDKDKATLEGMRQQAAALAEALGGLLDGQPPRTMPNGSSLHYMGSFRMGAVDDGESVCDSNGAVWQTRGLFVGGNGIIPTPTACNPTATSVALAIRSARAALSSVLMSQIPEGEATNVG